MTYAIGNALSELPKLDAGMARCCVTSPPYWGLRDYGHADQIGLEETPDAYVARLVDVFREVRRVLADDGTLWLNIGDSYASNAGGYDENGSRGTTSSKRISAKTMAAVQKGNGRKPPNGLKPKDLVGIPWRVAFALQADGWWLRSDCIWHKPNPMPESVEDRPTKAHEYVFLLSKSERYFYDAAAVAEQGTGRAPGNAGPSKYGQALAAGDQRYRTAGCLERIRDGYESRNCRTVWTIPTHPYAGAHFATMPPALVTRCILAGSKLGDVVLDPFFGSGTVGEVAEQLGRRWFGIELNPAYEPLILARTRQRGMFGQVPA